jgi:hypothetical protein
MKKLFEEAEVEIISVDADIITTSDVSDMDSSSNKPNITEEDEFP